MKSKTPNIKTLNKAIYSVTKKGHCYGLSGEKVEIINDTDYLPVVIVRNERENFHCQETDLI